MICIIANHASRNRGNAGARCVGVASKVSTSVRSCFDHWMWRALAACRLRVLLHATRDRVMTPAWRCWRERRRRAETNRRWTAAECRRELVLRVGFDWLLGAAATLPSSGACIPQAPSTAAAAVHSCSPRARPTRRSSPTHARRLTHSTARPNANAGGQGQLAHHHSLTPQRGRRFDSPLRQFCLGAGPHGTTV